MGWPVFGCSGSRVFGCSGFRVFGFAGSGVGLGVFGRRSMAFYISVHDSKQTPVIRGSRPSGYITRNIEKQPPKSLGHRRMQQLESVITRYGGMSISGLAARICNEGRKWNVCLESTRWSFCQTGGLGVEQDDIEVPVEYESGPLRRLGDAQRALCGMGEWMSVTVSVCFGRLGGYVLVGRGGISGIGWLEACISTDAEIVTTTLPKRHQDGLRVDGNIC